MTADAIVSIKAAFKPERDRLARHLRDMRANNPAMARLIFRRIKQAADRVAAERWASDTPGSDAPGGLGELVRFP